VVKKALGSHDIAPHVGYNKRGKLTEQFYRQDVSEAELETVRLPAGVTFSPKHENQRQPSLPFNSRRQRTATQTPSVDKGELSQHLYGTTPDFPVTSRTYVPSSVTSDTEHFSEIEEAEDERLLWQLHNKYILTHIRSGLLILDQHAAHERILYERALKTMESGLGLSQQLLFPDDLALIKELLPDLRALGFDLVIRKDRVELRGVPADIRTGDERHMLEEILEQYKNYEQTLQIKGRDNLAKSLACKSAIKTGHRLSYQEMRALIDQLFSCDMPYACPHGRPIMIKISLEELDRRGGGFGCADLSAS